MIAARFTKDVQEAILERDNYKCVICWDPATRSPHHVYFALQANYNVDRNNIDQWASTCIDCHEWAHACKSWEWIRQQFIDYLLNLENEYRIR